METDTKPDINESDKVFQDNFGNNNAKKLNDSESNPARPANQDKSIKSLEDNPNDNIINKFTGANNKSKARGNILKRKGPLGVIIALVFGGGLGFSALFSPGILLVQMKEELVNRFDTQLASMDRRTTKVMQAKFDSTTSGICAGKLTIKCRYSTMSEKQVAKFKAAGIEVKSTSTNIFGRTKPDTYIFKGEEISSKDFSTKLHTDLEFNAAVKKAYNPKFAGFSDTIWDKFASLKGLSKQKNLPEGDAAAKEKAIADETKNGTKIAPTGDGMTCSGSPEKCIDNNTGKEVPPDEAKKIQAATADANKAIEEAAQSADNVAKDVLPEVTSKIGNLTSVAGHTLSVTGYLDNACQMYNSVRALGYAAKTVRAIQLARYAMVFLNTADQIKAGTATPGDVAYLGGILTNIAYDAKAGANRKAAMDSFGMKYTMFGEVGKSDSYVSQFMAGGGLTGDLIAITSYINNTLTGGSAAKTCKTLSNGWIQAASAISGIALLFVPGVDIVVGANDIIKAGSAILAQVAMMALPGLLKDIIAGNVTKNISAEGSGNAITSGAGSAIGGLAQFGGNGPMTVSDAVTYKQTQDEVLASYTTTDIATLSPFDATNQNTFLGSIVNKLLPYSANLSSLSGSLTSISSIIGTSFSSLIPKSQALTTAQSQAAYTSCTDEDYKAIGIATDPFCNVIYGLPTQYLNRDPIAISDALIASRDIYENGQTFPGSHYESFLNDCINRKEPLGSAGDSGTGSDGKECIVKDTNANYYLYYIDQRVNNGMGDETPATDNPTISTTANSIIDIANIYNDSTGIACAPGTTDAGVEVGYNNSVATPVRLCNIPNATVSGKNSPIQVNSRVSGAFLSLINAYMTDKKVSSLTVADSFRSMAEQQAAWAKYGAPRAAKPGYSNHQMGLAIDFQLPTGNNGATKPAGTDATYDWLTADGSKYGIGQISGEAWHWQPIGIR